MRPGRGQLWNAPASAGLTLSLMLVFHKDSSPGTLQLSQDVLQCCKGRSFSISSHTARLQPHPSHWHIAHWDMAFLWGNMSENDKEKSRYKDRMKKKGNKDGKDWNRKSCLSFMVLCTSALLNWPWQAAEQQFSPSCNCPANSSCEIHLHQRYVCSCTNIYT